MMRSTTLPGHWIAAGVLEQAEVEDALYGAAVANGLADDDGERQGWATIRSGLSAGLQEPIDLRRNRCPQIHPFGTTATLTGKDAGYRAATRCSSEDSHGIEHAHGGHERAAEQQPESCHARITRTQSPPRGHVPRAVLGALLAEEHHHHAHSREDEADYLVHTHASSLRRQRNGPELGERAPRASSPSPSALRPQ